jgi:hypothetical protein
MFKAHILVSEDTDVAAALADLERLAQKHSLDDAKIYVLMRNVESVLADLKQQDSETAAYGIKMAVEKTVATDDYRVTLKLSPRKEMPKKSGPLSWLFGK